MIYLPIYEYFKGKYGVKIDLDEALEFWNFFFFFFKKKIQKIIYFILLNNFILLLKLFLNSISFG